jgi:hypothetical protein
VHLNKKKGALLAKRESGTRLTGPMVTSFRSK